MVRQSKALDLQIKDVICKYLQGYIGSIYFK